MKRSTRSPCSPIGQRIIGSSTNARPKTGASAESPIRPGSRDLGSRR